MKPATLLISVLAAAISVSAQVTAAMNRLPDGSTEIRLRNNSAVPLTTLALGIDYVNRISPTPQPLIVFIDPVIDQVMPGSGSVVQLATMPLLPQQEITISPEVLVAISPLSGRPGFSGFVTGGIFADGTTFGDTGLLTRLAIRRSNMLLAVETTLDVLSNAGRHNVPRNVLVSQFNTLVESLNRWYLPDEQRVGLSLYHSLIRKLIDLPDGELGSAFPPDAFVAQQAGQLIRQRSALMQAEPIAADRIAR